MSAPAWTATLQSILTSAAIVVGGGWAIWKWGYSEGLRKRRELPDLDGTLTASAVALSAGKACLTLQAAWRNPGPVPIKMCPDHSFVTQFALPGDPPPGNFRLHGHPGAEEICQVPLTWLHFTMGPQTTSVMNEHFVVATDVAYYFYWVICQGQISRRGVHHAWCERDLIWSWPQLAGSSEPKASHSGIRAALGSARRMLRSRRRFDP
jgi:hypothetical protein